MGIAPPLFYDHDQQSDTATRFVRRILERTLVMANRRTKRARVQRWTPHQQRQIASFENDGSSKFSRESGTLS
jgi:hypothetical protein